MKIIRSARLANREGASDKVYEVDLVENDGLRAQARFLVNYRYGRRGTALREGTRTADPIPLERAERVFDSIVVSKVNEGYRRTDAAAESNLAGIGGARAAEGREAVLLARLEASRHGPWGATNIDRLLWRIGEVRVTAAAPALRDMAARRPAEASYSLVFALARCAGAEGAPALKAIAGSAASQLVRELARFALVCPLMGSARETAGLDPALPESVIRAAEARDADRIAGALADVAAAEPVKVGPALAALARASQDDAGLKSAFAAAIRRMPARPPYLIGLRKLYKYAEMADDKVLFAATAHRFETAEPMYGRPGWRGQTYIRELRTTVPLDAVRGRPDTPVGLSGATLAYFKRRIWRTLRKRGELEDPAFAELACAYLLSLKPGDLAKRATWTRFKYRPEDRSWSRVEHAMGPLGRNWTASQLLYRNDPQALPRYGSLTFHEVPGTPPGGRVEAFPELWSRRPDLALRLAAESECEPVAGLGLRVLEADPAYLGKVSSDDLARLLASPHAPVLQLAFREVRDRLARGAGDAELLAALIESTLPEARRLAVERIEREPSLPWSILDLAFAALRATHADMAEPILRWARERPLGQGLSIPLAERLAEWWLALPASLQEDVADRVRAARSRMRVLWPGRDMPLAPGIVRRLVRHPSVPVVAAGIDVLALTGTDPETLPEESWRDLLGSAEEEIQEAALFLFGGLGQETLARHAPLVAAFATAPSSRLRQAARPLVARIAARDPAFADRMARQLIDSLFAAAPDEAYPDDIVALLREAFSRELAALDAGVLWRLLQARAKGAQLLGARLLDERPHENFSVRQTARLGNHAHLSVRQWVMAAIESAPARFQAEAADAVLLLESRWPETYEFARAQFGAWPAQTWSPEALAIVTDSVKPEVLAFALQLLRSRLSPEDAEGQLTRLLEHPAQSMHLLVTELLTQDAAASEAAFDRLLPLARIVMLQVAKGRVAKDRMAAFLKAEALRDPERARRIAPLFSDLTLSGLERDRAHAVLALRDIERTYPAIASPLTRLPVAERAAR